jgi:quinoprotein glucose dehydrogenase
MTQVVMAGVKKLFPGAILLLACLAVSAQEWQYYGQDSGGARFSGLTQINADNVDELELAWSHRYGDLSKYPEHTYLAGYHVTPILLPEEAGRSLIACTPFHKMFALDPATGEERWSFDSEITFGPFKTRLKCLGVAYWEDSELANESACKYRVYMGTSDRRIISLDARTGSPCKDFGENGQVDVNPIIARTPPVPDSHWGMVYSAPPVLVNDVLVIGSINNMKNQFPNAANGSIRGFDARTGEFLWDFDPVPRNPDDPEAANWDPEALKTTGGGNVWSMFSVDHERDLIFLPTASTSPNFYGGTRPGDNRYGNSLVALRGATGEIVWHFQMVHHDVWDWDLPAQPILVDMQRNGETIPAVVQLTKQGLIFVFNRETGEPVFPIEERPVPTDGVPGDILSPTQPFPVKPPPIIRTELSEEDAWGLTALDEGFCRKWIKNSRHGPLFTPPSLDMDGWIMYPSTAGGPNWGGGAYDKDRNVLITNVSEVGIWMQFLPEDSVETKAFDPFDGAPMGPAAPIRGTGYALKQRILLSPIFMPCTKPPWGSLVAVDMNKGEINWSVPLGVIDRIARMPIPLKWGTPLAGGPIVTASGLIFIGSTTDRRLRVFSTDTGKELWQIDLPSSAHATPMTYEVDGRQYVVIASGGHAMLDAWEIDDYLLAFALPEK